VNGLVTRGIVLARTDYGEADRIVTMLTPDHGKLRLMARGVRKPKSKLAGGIELFSVSDITFITGRGEIGTLISTRLLKHYGKIVTDIDRVQLGYELIKTLHRATEDHPEPDYFELLDQALQALDDSVIHLDLIHAWFDAQLLRLAGHSPNLSTDTAGVKLHPDQAYNFDLDAMAFAPHEAGNFKADHIKLLRLLFGRHQPTELRKVQGTAPLLPRLMDLLTAMRQSL
jgi:DNA repair protein RecO (recombination protein O)